MALKHSDPFINTVKEVLITLRPLIIFADIIRIIQKAIIKTIEDFINKLT
jgi:hypothetical protein